MKTRCSTLFALVVVLALASGIGTAQAAPARPPKFEITAIAPNPTRAIANAPAKNLKITWSGTPVFPVTAFLVPTAHCAPAGFTCSGGQASFTKNKDPLVWKSAVSCFGTFTKNVSLKFKIYLQDAHGAKTAQTAYTLICKP